MDNQIQIFKESLQYFSNFYNFLFKEELPNFIHKDEKTRQSVLDEIYKHNSKLECLLREANDDDLFDEQKEAKPTI